MPITHLIEELARRMKASPEFWSFEQGASFKEILKLEHRLHCTLPDDLKSLLETANGGFASQMGKISIDCPTERGMARQNSHFFLSTREIHEAKKILLSCQDEIMDGAIFPWIPIMQTFNGSFLCLRADLSTSPIYEAWPDSEPHDWAVVWHSLTELLVLYLHHNGDLPLEVAPAQ